MNSLSTHYIVRQAVLDASRDFLYQVGLKGCEGCGLWVGTPGNSGNVQVTRFFAPEQICTKSIYGVSVDLTPRANLTLTDNLNRGEQFFVRIHSHPGRAYHSAKDDANPILTHQGTLSIVVPNFARQPLELVRCAVYRLQHGKGWLPLTVDEIKSTFAVVP